MNFRNFFTSHARIARPPDPPLDRFEHEHPESFAFPPHRMLDAIDYAKFHSRSHDAVICVYDDAGNVIETHEHAGDFKEWWKLLASALAKNPIHAYDLCHEIETQLRQQGSSDFWFYMRNFH
jgi:hypothetical protein